MTGIVVTIESNTAATRYAPPRQTGRRQRLLCGLSAIAFLAAVALPVTIDATSMAPAFTSAHAAGNDNGNGDGQGRGEGNGKGRGDENGGGKKPPKDDDDDADDDAGDDEHGNPGSNQAGGGKDSGTDGYDDVDETALADAPAGIPTTALPTIQQIFAMGEESVLNTDQEMLAIENGWNTPN